MEKTQEVRVLHLVGDRFAVRVRGHEFTVDQPLANGGLDMSPTPTELFVASIASCVAFFGRRFLRTHELPEEIDVVARWEFGRAPARVATIELGIDAPTLPEALRGRFLQVVEHCTVENSLTHAPEVSFHLSAGETIPAELILS